MAGIKRNYKLIFRYLRAYGKTPHVLRLMDIRRKYQGEERSNKCKELIDELVTSGEINPIEIYKLYRKDNGV